ncbi:helix-turn-helix transcriptional regulator [Nocardioides endophyticus]|uniref:helix-turn-helix transcriptional regulator n=1 Tax=Nocardioides endophyticus TaxID=1353775 RepID=UPI0031ED0D8A
MPTELDPWGGTLELDPLVPPRGPGRLVPRPELLRRLDRMSPLTVVEALPGFGKSALGLAWAREHEALGGHVVWIGASAAVKDVAAFMRLLRRGLARSGVTELSGLVQGAGRFRRSSGWFDELAAAERPTVVIIDDAHLLADPVIAETFVDLVRRAPLLYAVVLAEPGHHFHRAADLGKLETNVLRGRDLAVRADEVQTFVAAWGHEIDARAARMLHGLTGGWLLPLRLVLDATPAASAEFATHVAGDFMVNTVLPGLGVAGTDTTAMRFAVPDRFDSELASVLVRLRGTPEQSAEETAGALERQGLLWRLPSDAGATAWEYPPLMRRALIEHFQRVAPDEARAAHGAVARHLAQVADDVAVGQAMRHGRAAEDWALLVGLWSKRGWSLPGIDPGSFEAAYSALPVTVQQQFPALAVPAALGDALRSSHDLDWTRRVDILFQHYARVGLDHLADARRIEDPRVLAELLTAAMVARRGEGRLAEAHRLSLEVSRVLDRARLSGEPQWRWKPQAAWYHLQSAITRLSAGELGGVVESVSTAHGLSPRTPVGASAAGLLSALHAVGGQRAQAERWLAAHETVDLADRWTATYATLPAQLTRSMLALDRLDLETSRVALQHAPVGPELGGLWPLVVLVHTRHALLGGDALSMLSVINHLHQVYAHQIDAADGVARQVIDRCTAEVMLATAEVNRFQSWVDRMDSIPAWLATPTVRLHLMTGNLRKAAELAVSGVWQREVQVRDRLMLIAIHALASHLLGRPEAAHESFRQTLSLSADTGDLEALLVFPTEVRHELLSETGSTLDAETTRLLDSVACPYPRCAELVALSEREREVLTQLQRHETAADLARTLTVSVNTIKKQLVSLYAKLEVHDRSAALVRAEGLGLLEQRVGRPTDRDR